MSLGGGVVMSATRSASPPIAREPVTERSAPLPPAFYAARAGGMRDYWTLLHPPYTIWHLSYVLLGASLAPSPDPRIVAGTLVAFALAVGLGAHAFDEVRGRPLRTRIPSSVLVAIGGLALAAAVGLGIVASTLVGPGLLVFVTVGAALVLLYAFEVPVVHSDLGFAFAWGAFPVLTSAFATGAHPVPSIIAAAGAAWISLAQRRLSTRARSVRRRATAVDGEIVYADGSHERIDRDLLIAAPEAALRVLWLAVLAISAGSLLARWL